MNHRNQDLYQSPLPCPLGWPSHLQSPPVRKVAARAPLRKRRRKMKRRRRRKKRVKVQTPRKKGLIAWQNYRNRYFVTPQSLLGKRFMPYLEPHFFSLGVT
jgi:hypothetical protein